MKIDRQSRKIARQAFRASHGAAGFDDARAMTTLKLLGGLAERRRLAVLQEFRRLVRIEIDKRTAFIESAEPLSEMVGQRILGDVQARYGTNLIPRFVTNPSLIAGTRVRVGSDVWDGSIRARLDRLATSFHKS